MNDDFEVTDSFIKLITKIRNFFEDRNIKYWLDEGTLLGIFRDGELIKGDHDFDFSAEYSDISEIVEICESLKKHGYHIKYQSGLPYVEDMIQIYLHNDFEMKMIHVDINIYFISNDKAIRRDLHYPVGKYGRFLVSLARVLYRKKIYYKNSNNFKKMLLISFIPFRLRRLLSYICMDIYIKFCTSLWQVVPSKYFSNLTKIELFDNAFNIPLNCENYLSYRYGEDWRIPNKNWIWRDSPDQAIEYKRLNLLNIEHESN